MNKSRYAIVLLLIEWCGCATVVLSLTGAQSPSEHSLLILGLGRCGREVARQATLNYPHLFGNNIYGTVRNTSGGLMNNDNVQRVMFDADSIRPIVSQCSHILLTLPPPEEDDRQALETWHCIEKFLPLNSWIGLISTTSVYGNHNGDWVTEESECRGNPTYQQWESRWKKLASGKHQCRVFRCAGIYSQDRSALHTVYKKGITKPRTVDKTITSRIHVEDIAGAILASMKLHTNAEAQPDFDTYNLADDLPESRQLVLEHAANLLKNEAGFNASYLESSTDELSIRTRRRGTDRKRVCNEKMKADLLPTLRYPTYKEGLAKIVNDCTNPWWDLEARSSH